MFVVVIWNGNDRKYDGKTFAVFAGASHIIVIETQENKRESAKDYGATLFINPNVEMWKR